MPEPRYFIRGQEVSWPEMKRWLNIRTLAWWSREAAVWVLFGKLGLDEIRRISYCSVD